MGGDLGRFRCRQDWGGGSLEGDASRGEKKIFGSEGITPFSSQFLMRNRIKSRARKSSKRGKQNERGSSRDTREKDSFVRRTLPQVKM